MGKRAILEGIRMDVECLGKGLTNEQALLYMEAMEDYYEERIELLEGGLEWKEEELQRALTTIENMKQE